MKKITPLVFLLVLISCTNSLLNETVKDFPNQMWSKSDVKTFEFEAKKDFSAAAITVKFSHIFEPGYHSVPLKITISHPEGEQQTEQVELSLTDDSGKKLSDCGGDICDLEQIVLNNISLKKGTYTISIQHGAETDALPNVLALGLEVNPVK